MSQSPSDDYSGFDIVKGKDVSILGRLNSLVRPPLQPKAYLGCPRCQWRSSSEKLGAGPGEGNVVGMFVLGLP